MTILKSKITLNIALIFSIIIISTPVSAEECFYHTYVRLMAKKYNVSTNEIVKHLPTSRKINMKRTNQLYSKIVSLHGSSYALSEISKQTSNPVDIAVMSYCVAVFDR